MHEAIRPAASPADFDAFAGLIADYVEWCRARYRDHPHVVDQVFGYQSLATELETLASSYGPPEGKTLLTLCDGQVCAGGAYRRLAEGSCEMKRLFVRNDVKGRGIGRRLCTALVDAARDEGFERMRLDTGNLFTEAIAMYESLGFRRCTPYRRYPAALMPYLVFMEIPLRDGSSPGD
ncbi:MAG: GNAT family N-acetyltransferase [Casimicrobiaceae bacterium]